ncbi:rhodanese-like domain-containing protein [Arthrobacter sp. AQ5-05]|uniref:rhodanese-like domain-containing protein n=1 Tax=Arthrobacter sp. AQ5-05 TaxID=2184581 RepID=UPI0012B51B28|nr:rhodanese-like domain-containing protein [Arthrobacter sp. AQ5-05]
MIIDAGGRAEFDALHISGSYHVSQSLFRECPEEFAEKVCARLALVCHSGDRAEHARKQLDAVGRTGTNVLFGGFLGAKLISPKWGLIASVVGAGLTYSAATNRCAMSQVLSKMSWNRTVDEPTGHHALQKLGSRP